MLAHSEPAHLAASPADYVRFKVAQGYVEPWEDGIRLDTSAPNVEWWYFDSLLDDGAKLTVTFNTKDASRRHQPLEPLIEIDLDLPDGRRLTKYGRLKAAEFAASTQGCDVRIGESHFAGDLHEYHITAAAEDASVEARLVGTTEPWRPATGHMVFGSDSATIFGWTVPVPLGKVTATYRVGSETHETTGTGYHDHNWINQEMADLVDHWYWGRGHVGPYSFVMAHITTAKTYGYTPISLYMLARDGKVLADDATKVTFTTSGSETDEHTGKPVPDALRFAYRDGDTSYVLTFSRQRTLVSQRFLDLTRGWQKLAAEIIRYPGGYLRFSGPVSLDRYQGSEIVEQYEERGIFEQCYFARELHDETKGS